MICSPRFAAEDTIKPSGLKINRYEDVLKGGGKKPRRKVGPIEPQHFPSVLRHSTGVYNRLSGPLQFVTHLIPKLSVRLRNGCE